MGNTIGDSVSFEAYLDKKHQYTTNSNPNMQQVLDLANEGKKFTTKNGYPAKATVGQKGFWERANDKMKKSLDDTMRSFLDNHIDKILGCLKK